MFFWNSDQMTSLIIKAEWVVLPGGTLKEGPFIVTIVADTITGVEFQGSCLEQECLSTYLLTPGFIDIHTHGVGE